jgi:hypothetical protein
MFFYKKQLKVSIFYVIILEAIDQLLQIWIGVKREGLIFQISFLFSPTSDQILVWI